jgi:PAS domain S-box-containing protein
MASVVSTLSLLERDQLLATTTAVLGESFAYEEAVLRCAAAVVPLFADWCVIDVLHGDGVIDRLASVHRDPGEGQAALDQLRDFTPPLDGELPVPRAMRRGESTLVSHVDDALIRTKSSGAAHTTILSRIHTQSYICVPLTARGRHVGAISFGLVADRYYNDDDLTFAQILASRAAVAVEATRLLAEYEQELAARREMERLHRDSERRYRLLFEEHPRPLWVYDAATLRILAVNQAAVRTYGYSREEFLGLTIVDLRPESEVPKLMAAIEHRYVHGDSFSGLFRHRTKLGVVLDVEVHISDTTFDGRDARITLIEDVTARELAGEALRQSEERFRLVLKATKDVVYEVDLYRDRYLWNESAAPAFGLAPEALPMTQDAFIGLLHPDDQARMRTSFLRSLYARGEAGGAEYRLAHADGRWLQITDRWYVQRDERGQPERVIGALRDVSERRHLQQQIAHLQKMEAVGRVAGGVAHDFNNMLTAINGFAEMALDELGPGDGARHDVEQIQRAAARAAGLTSRLLAFSRKQVLQPRVIDVADTIQDLSPLLGRILGGAIGFEVRANAIDLRIRVDPGQFEQVLVNLAVNARDAMPDGGTLTIETERMQLGDDLIRVSDELSPGPYGVISVSDTGVGMDAATRQRIFEPFFTTKPAGKGTGLGLAMVYGVIAQSGGFMDVTSTPGAGSCFRLYFPETDDALDTTERSTKPREVSRGGERVFVVEDEPLVRQLTLAALAHAGYDVLEAPDGLAALSVAEGLPEPPALLLSDVMMPGLTGPALARTLRERWPTLPVLFMSGYADPGEEPRDRVGPDDDFLQKPFTTEALLSRVRAAIDAAALGTRPA